MSHTVVTLPSTLASPSRVFLSPFPPPQTTKEVRPKTITAARHSVYPYKISSDLSRQGRYSAKVASELPNQSIHKNDYDEVLSLYYYDRQRRSRPDQARRSLTPSVSSSTSLSSSFFSNSDLRSSISTPLLKPRQSRQQQHQPKWIKHVSQSSGLLTLEKKIARSFPFRSPPTLHLSMLRDNSTPPPKAIYHGSVLARQYLKSVTQTQRWDDMIQHGFPCPHALHTTTSPPRCPDNCHQCGGQQRLMTLRITFTPLHARANENDIYNSTRRATVPFPLESHPIYTE